MYIIQMINALRVGGAEKLIATFAQVAQKKDIKLGVITLRQNTPELVAQIESYGAKVVAFNHRKIQSGRRFFNLVQFLRHEKPDIIHTHLTMATILGSASGSLSGVPVVTSLHNTNMSTSNKFLLSSIETFMLRYVIKHVIAVGWHTAVIHQPRLRKKQIDVIPNAVVVPAPASPAAILETRSKLTGDSKLPILLSVNRLELQKGIFDLIGGFALIHQRYPDVRLVIAGSGSLENRIKARIDEAGLAQSVHMLGLRQDIPDLLAASDIFVSAAHWEGLPVASLEAMAAGRPLVATAVGDLPRVIIPGTGLLVPSHDPTALAAGISCLLDDPALGEKIGKAARNHVIHNYSADVWVDRLLGIYTNAICQSPFVKKQAHA